MDTLLIEGRGAGALVQVEGTTMSGTLASWQGDHLAVHVPGHSYFGGQSRPRLYAPAAFHVYAVAEELPTGIANVRRLHARRVLVIEARRPSA